MNDYLSISDVNQYIVESRRFVKDWEKYSTLFDPHNVPELATRRAAIIQVLRDETKTMESLFFVPYMFGSLITLNLTNILAYAAKIKSAYETVAKFIDAADTLDNRIKAAATISYLRPSGDLKYVSINSSLIGTVPLKEWFTETEQKKLLTLFFEDCPNNILWIYITRIKSSRQIKNIFIKANIIPTKKNKLNQYILFSALVQRKVLSWCRVPIIRHESSTPLSTLLSLLGQYNFNSYNLYVLRPNSSFKTDDRCAICLNPMFGGKHHKLKQTACNHVFHSKCLFEWLAHKPSCPLCKRTIIHKAISLGSL